MGLVFNTSDVFFFGLGGHWVATVLLLLVVHSPALLQLCLHFIPLTHVCNFLGVLDWWTYKLAGPSSVQPWVLSILDASWAPWRVRHSGNTYKHPSRLNMQTPQSPLMMQSLDY